MFANDNSTNATTSEHSADIIEEQHVLSYLTQLDFEELFDIDILDIKAFSAAKKQQKLTDTAAALFVITQEDIRRAGITHVAEALRLVPGIQVARTDANKWAISSRGFNDLYSSKLLVMIDGRTVYNPLRSEVLWYLQDLFIEDIERIEVIRGPGASLWGANAVNGVINILTKSAQKTEGGLLTASLGTGEENAILGYRHGGKIKDDLYYRAYGKLYQHDNFVDPQGEAVKNEWKMRQAGFRMDWEFDKRNELSLHGSLYQGDLNQHVLLLYPNVKAVDDRLVVRGHNLLASWKRNTGKSSTVLKSYFTHSRYKDIFYTEKRDIFDLDWQQHYKFNPHYEVVWGLAYRYTKDNFPSQNENDFIRYKPNQRTDNLFSAFIQNEFWLKPDKLRLTLGSKFEYNDYTGFEVQPTARLLWKLDETKSAWAAVSRAVRTPSRMDHTLSAQYANEPPFSTLYISGSSDFKAEILVAYELGLHWQLSKQSFIDISLFLNDYDELGITKLTNISLTPPAIYFEIANGMQGEIFGAELAGVWQVNDAVNIKAAYTYMKTQLHIVEPADNSIQDWELVEGNDPNHQASLNVFWTISPRWELDTSLYYVDDLPSQNTPNYTRLDMRLGWQPHPDWHFSLGVRNLFDSQHKEFGTGFDGNIAIPSDVRRSAYIQVQWQY
ncbi:TonB-dependent receptor [Candidatus Albibeggiatoa sp. nov. BB20]|uniref:TonB-dependent receptor plug domain-containing protein n=1 Tax=Candidatus Albibeggiatoa sp. nov. BB20 TaxID=3162723 RepID=UPI003365339A